MWITLLFVVDAGVNPETGQVDYSAAWAEYYRQLGMHDQANAILQRTAPGGTILYRQ